MAELQRLQQQQQQQGVPVSSADAVLDPQEDATRGLGQDLEPEGRQVADELADVPDAGIGLPAAAENMQDGIAGAAAANSVEADYVLEPQGPQPPGLHQDGQEELEISRCVCLRHHSQSCAPEALVLLLPQQHGAVTYPPTLLRCHAGSRKRCWPFCRRGSTWRK